LRPGRASDGYTEPYGPWLYTVLLLSCAGRAWPECRVRMDRNMSPSAATAGGMRTSFGAMQARKGRVYPMPDARDSARTHPGRPLHEHDERRRLLRRAVHDRHMHAALLLLRLDQPPLLGAHRAVEDERLSPSAATAVSRTLGGSTRRLARSRIARMQPLHVDTVARRRASTPPQRPSGAGRKPWVRQGGARRRRESQFVGEDWLRCVRSARRL
jgi:hypothetical protein